MFIKQLSIFVENKPGRLSAITKLLGDNKIDIRAMSIADTRDFGILRLIVNDPDKALEVLRSKNCIVTETAVIGARLRNEPGALATVVRVLSEGDINVEYMYAFNGATPHHAYVVLRVTDNDKVAELLLKEGIKCITQEQVAEI